jgi:hypothetical protein
MILRTQPVYSLNQNAQVIRINIRRDAMPQVEYMARTVAVTGEHVRNTLFDGIRRFPKHGWIQVSL